MAQNKPTPPWVYVLLTLAAVAVGWFVWNAATAGDRANRQLEQDTDKAEDALRDLQREVEKNK